MVPIDVSITIRAYLECLYRYPMSKVSQREVLILLRRMRAVILPVIYFYCDCLPIYNEVLPFRGPSIAGYRRFGHSQTGGLSPFGIDFAKGQHVWSDTLCAIDSDGDGYSNGDELGDPCCLYNYWIHSGQRENIMSTLHEDRRSLPGDPSSRIVGHKSCTASDIEPLNASNIGVYTGRNGAIIDWADALGRSQECVCHVSIRSEDGTFLYAPWGHTYAVIPADTRNIHLTFHNLLFDSRPSSTLSIEGQNLAPHPSLFNEPLTISQPEKPSILPDRSPGVDESPTVIASPIVAFFLTGLILLIGRIVLRRYLNSPLGLPPVPSKKGLLGLAAILVIGIALLFAVKAEGGNKIDYSASLGQVAVYFLSIAVVAASKNVVQPLLDEGFERVIRYHGVITLFAMAFVIAHAIAECVYSGYNFWNIRLGISSLAFLVATTMSAALPIFVKLPYDLFLANHIIFWIVTVSLIFAHLGYNGRSWISAAIILALAVLSHIPGKMAFFARLVKPNYIISRCTPLGNSAVCLEFKASSKAFRYRKFLPGRWVGIQLQGPPLLTYHPFTVIPTCDKTAEFRLVIGRSPGPFCTYLWNNMEALEGRPVRVSGPHGAGNLPAVLSKNSVIVFLCGGTGITPAMSLVSLASSMQKKVFLFWPHRNNDMSDLLLPVLSDYVSPGNGLLSDLRLITCMNTDEDGIPDVKQYISRVCAEVGGEEQIGLFVCGPVPLQNACWSAYLHCRNSFNNVAGFHAEVFRFI